MYWDILNMKPKDFIKLQKEINKMLKKGKEYQIGIKENERRRNIS